MKPTWKSVFTGPYRWRTKLRVILPPHFCGLCLHRLFLYPRDGDDCERRGGLHEWFNLDDENSRCFHCGIVRPGKLWPGGQTTQDWATALGVGHLPGTDQIWLSQWREMRRGNRMWSVLSNELLEEFQARMLVKEADAE
jgi:hypothetical protein